MHSSTLISNKADFYVVLIILTFLMQTICTLLEEDV